MHTTVQVLQTVAQEFSLQLNGVTKDTRITIRPLDMDKTDKQGADYKVQRYHLDNILIKAVAE